MSSDSQRLPDHLERVIVMTMHSRIRGPITVSANGNPSAVLAELQTTFADFISAQRREMDQVNASMDDMASRLAAAQIGGGSMPSGPNAVNLRLEREAIGQFIKAGDPSALINVNAMSTGEDANGGFLVLPAMSDSMTTKIWDQSAMRRLARIVTIESGDAWEEVIDHDEAGAEWVGETAARNATDTPRLGKLIVPLHELHASPKTTQKLLDTSFFNIGEWLEAKITDKFGRSEGVAYISGDGILKPNGVLSGTPVTTGDATRAWGTLQYFATGAAAGFASSSPADALRDMVWGLRAPYRRGAVWLMNSNTASKIDKFKDGDGNYIWRMGMTAGAPPSLLGYPVEFDENMPDVGAGEFPIAFGNFALGYVIVELASIQVLRDPFTNKPNVIFYTTKRVGGDIANSEAIKLLKVATS
ncbi:phage major capsid protein [Oricola sp.]|uniref:phage major capsid protein n=1 Tax=Oricola sp. TaxID=1979950 RepID=UPI0025EABE49|nr:phage major capsid protein [Oricola sp.]MCI5078249.1 phage major capsid protein [Oricola sp.]